MGKYRASLIHEWWSDWHYQRTKSDACMTDTDDIVTQSGNQPRVWNEIRENRIIVALELKWQYAIEMGRDCVTETENTVMRFYELQNIPFFILGIDALKPKPEFHIYRPFVTPTRLTKLLEDEMIDWINQDYELAFLNHKILNPTIEAKT